MSARLANMAVMAKTTNTGASRFTTRFTQAQKHAILKAVLIDGHTVKTARDMARAGQLDVPAFEIGTYAYDIVKADREAFELANETALDLAIDAELRKTAGLALAHNRALLAKARRDGTDDPDALKRSAQALSAIKRARREAQTGSNQRAKAKPAQVETTAETVNTDSGASVVASLLGKADGGRRTGSLAHAQS